MVREDIVKYFFEGIKRGFSVDLLKNKLFEAGFLKEEVEEASIAFKKRHSGLNFIKFTSFLGFFFLVVVFLLSLINFIHIFRDFIDEFAHSNTIFSVILGIILILLFFVYYIGFFVLGSKTSSKFFKIYSVLMLLAGIILLLIHISHFISYTEKDLHYSPLFYYSPVFSPDLSERNLVNFANIQLHPSEEAEIVKEDLNALFSIPLVAVFLLIYLIARSVFVFGLVKLKNKMSFSKIAIIFNILHTISIFLILVLIVILLNNEQFFSYLINNEEILFSIFSFIVRGIFFSIAFLVILFEALLLNEFSKIENIEQAFIENNKA